MKPKLNGVAKWTAIGIVIITHIAILAYNTGVTHNEVKHLAKELAKVTEKLEKLWWYIVERDTN